MPPAYLRAPSVATQAAKPFVSGCTGKVSLTRGAAQALARRKPNQSAVHCPHCSSWHTRFTGSMSLSAAQLRQMGHSP